LRYSNSEDFSTLLQAECFEAAVGYPPTVQAVVAARIDRLEENAKEVLEIASVLGREISTSILDVVAGLALPSYRKQSSI
jgi:predicted ATPase